MTFEQLKKKKRVRILKRCAVPALKKAPFRKGVVQKVYIEAPKKPNSAKRKVIKVLLHTKRIIRCHIPGIGHNLSKHSVVLVRGGRTQDLIGYHYKPVRGKFDLAPVAGRITRRTKYGIK